MDLPRRTPLDGWIGAAYGIALGMAVLPPIIAIALLALEWLVGASWFSST